MKRLMTLVAALPLTCMAGTATLTWTAPTTNTDGSVITLPLTYETRWGACVGATSPTMGAISGSNASAVSPSVTPNLPAGRWCFDVAATAGGVQSARSSVGSKTILQAPPNAPTGLTVTGELVAYRQRIGGTPENPVLTYIPMGSVAAGTACVASAQAGGYTAVPRSSVTPTNRYQPFPFIVWALCA